MMTSNLSAKINPMPRTSLSHEFRVQLQASASRAFKQKGTIIFRAGESCRGAFLIRSGRIRLKFEGADHVYPTRILHSGFIAGLPATLSGEPYSLTAEATEDSQIDFIPRRKLLALLRRNPEIACPILRLLSEEIVRMRQAAVLAASGRWKKETVD